MCEGGSHDVEGENEPIEAADAGAALAARLSPETALSTFVPPNDDPPRPFRTKPVIVDAEGPLSALAVSKG